jgi:hypothetical protein
MRGLVVRTGLAFAFVACSPSVDVDSLFAPIEAGAVPDSTAALPEASSPEPDAEEPAEVGTGGGGSTGGTGGGGAGGASVELGGDAGTSAGSAGDPDAGRVDGAAGTDAGLEASVRDARREAAEPVDAEVLPKTIRCGSAQCDVDNEFCCIEDARSRCLKKNQASSCPKFAARLACDDRTDCPAAQSCCLVFLSAENRDDASCMASCGTSLSLCDPARSNQCPESSSCSGTSVVASYLYCR